MQMLAPFVAGLGRYFCGVHFLSTNLTPLAGRRRRMPFERIVWLARRSALQPDAAPATQIEAAA